MRHAKSSWDDFSISDFDRPLNKRGLKDAPLMGACLKEKKIKPSLILSSPAKRAKTTACSVAEVLGYPLEKIVYKESIYESSLYNLIMIVKEMPKECDVLLLIGHNPALTALFNTLGTFTLDNLPTAGVVALGFDTAWHEIEAQKGSLLFYEYPKKCRG